MFVNLKIKNFLFFFIFSLINSEFNKYYDSSEEIYYYSLPNEFPTIIKNIEYNKDKIEKIEKIFGYLPFTEQNYLSKFLDLNNDNSNIFWIKNADEKEIKTLKQTIWKEEIKAISHYIEKNEKMLLSGLGCVKTVLQKYGFKTEFNRKLYDDAYEKINNILQAQKNFISHTNNFFNKIQKIIFDKRLKFLNETNYDNLIEIDKENYFMDRNYYKKSEDGEENEIIGIKYNTEEQNSISDAFKEYLEKKEEYDIILNKNAMKIIMDISRMDGCKNYDDPDYNAGKSSDTVSSPEITYRHKKIVGINDISGIRNDKKTMNGYDLQHGYYLGTSENENYKPFPFDFANLILYFNNSIINDSDEGKEFKLKLDEIYNLKIDPVDFYPNLINLIPKSSIPGFLTENNLTVKLLNGEIYYYKKSNDEYIYYIKYNKDSKTLYDLVINGKSLGNDSSVIQSCFGVFTSGGKHDKNACRDVLTKDCGINLDYKCKKAGFYDYINANPAVIDKTIYEDKDLFKIFYKYFLLGGIAIRPSAFTGINLILQSYKNNDNKDILFKEFLNITLEEEKEEEKEEKEEEEEEEKEENEIQFSIFEGDIEKIQNNEIDKSNYNLISKSNYFRFKLIRIFFTFLFLYLI